MAGNIIPAIATTNAIIAGVIVLQALHLLRWSFGIPSVTTSSDFLRASSSKKSQQVVLTQTLRNMNIQSKPSVPLSASRIVPPNESCAVCRDTYASIRCDPAKTTLREVVDGISGSGEDDGYIGQGTGPRDVSVFESARLLADPDFDDNLDSTLESLNVTRGKFLTILSIAICELE
jgi:ubiquitin-like 1-activating enzyme E1 B